MRSMVLATWMVATAALSGASDVPAQDLFPTPEGRLGGREPLPTPAVVAPTPTPSLPTPTAVATPTPTPTGTATVTATALASPDGAATPAEATAAGTAASSPAAAVSPVAVETGALASVRAGTLTVVARGGGGATLGSGWSLDAEGRVVTASALLGDADQIAVVVADGRLLPATVLGADPLTGIAVLDVRGLGLSPLVAGGPTEPGLDVVAIGTVGGRFPGTMVEGIVSSTLGSLPERYPATVLIVTTAAPLEGMVGGPLVEAGTGEVVGLLVPGSQPVERGSALPPDAGARLAARLPGNAGLGFAVPIDTVVRVAAELIEQGRVAYPYLGAALEPVTIEQASRLGLAVVGGMLVGAVVEGGPADRARLEPGDVIVGIAGTQSGPPRPLLAALTERAPGEVVTLELLRDGTRMEVAVVLGERPPEG